MKEIKRADEQSRTSHSKLVWIIPISLAGALINLLGILISEGLHLPLYLDAVGTILISAICGYLPGIIVAILTSAFCTLSNPTAMYYSIIFVLIAVVTDFFARKKLIDRPVYGILLILILSIISGGHGRLLDTIINGLNHEAVTLSPHDFIWATLDMAISVIIVAVVSRLLSGEVKEFLKYDGWQQTPLSEEARIAAKKADCRKISIRTRILVLLTAASVMIAAASMIISLLLFRKSTQDEHMKLGRGVAALAASVIDPERVDEFISEGEAAPGYLEVKELLESVRSSSPDIEYLYVYKIENSGCRVVFDLDTEEMAGSRPGDLISFDESFYPLLPDLLAGNEIDPIIADDKYGWLLTAYCPVYDSAGICRCYAAVDVSMTLLRETELKFLIRLASIFLSFFILIMAFGLWISEYNIILPINSIALNTSAFAYDSDEARENNVERIRDLEIRTGDEVENLFKAILRTTENSMHYVEEIQEQNTTITNMQNGLILVLADVVESRDKCTGDHIRKTAAYTKIIMNSLKELGYYTDQLTDEFIYDVEHSAPLHDVGKIRISDTILNKPGKLTDEEFELMKLHTTYGKEIIEQSMEIVSDSGYLMEAKNLAAYHHEKWNGKGYPEGLSGEDIPLSARIMAVADVFDALVSVRSYKKAFTFEKAMDIIKEDAGTHFDPKVAEAFLRASDEVRRVSEAFEKGSEQDS